MTRLKSRRRAFAIPFVITASVLPMGCYVSTKPGPASPATAGTGSTPPPADPNVTAANPEATAGNSGAGTTGAAVIANPPPLDPNTRSGTTPVTAPPPADPNAKAGKSPVTAPPPADPKATGTDPNKTKSGSVASPAGDASTVKQAEKPRVIANPPPLPDAPPGANVVKNADGTCWFYAPPSTCPPKATCNPPPPRQVKCTPDAKPR